MYGLWLFKEIGTEYGACMVEIYRKNYTGESIEIGALAANSLSIALENLGSITDPIGKSVCSFSIIDTDQVEYDDFFTPDATALKVVVSSRVGSGAYFTRWSGYITPDFFAENLSFRTPISISARDNIGYLNDVDFDLVQSTITIRELITKAFARIAEDYPMSLSFVSQKQTAEGILAIDATISTILLKEMSWGEALETILHDLGMQMRWVDNNTIAVMDLSQIPEYYATQGFNFIGASGYREILPAWRQLSQSQDYGLRENFFNGYISSKNVQFVKEQVVDYDAPTLVGPPEKVKFRYYKPTNWLSQGEIYTLNPADYNFIVQEQNNELFKDKIYFTGIAADSTDYANHYMGWRQPVHKSNRMLNIEFKAFNAIMYTSNHLLPSLYPITLYENDRYQVGLKINVLLHTGVTTFILKQDWELLNGAESDAITFILPEIKWSIDGRDSKEEELTIKINKIPYDGELELRIYGHFKNPQHDSNVAISDEAFTKMVTYIKDVVYTCESSSIPTGQDSGVLVNELHNIKDVQDYTFGQVPSECGGINAYAGGLFKADGTELYGFQRNAEGENYNLLELVGREAIHFNKKNYNKLSGQIKNLDKEPLMFNRLFVREGKTYMPFSASLNIISNEMNITTMQEVEPYETASFAEINSELVTGGGATIGGGNNTILQYSEDAGNAKRVYELQAATEAEKEDGYVLIDNAGFPEAKKVHISEITGLDKEALEQYLQSGYFTGYKANDALMLGGQAPKYYATATGLTAVSNRVTELEKLFYYDAEHDAVRTSMSLIIDKWITFGGIGMGQGTVTGATELDGLNDVQITRPEGGQVLMYDEDLGLWVNKAGGVSGDYLPLSGGTIDGITDNPLVVSTTDATGSYIKMDAGGYARAAVGWSTDRGAFLYNWQHGASLAVGDDNKAYFGANDGNAYELIHSGNIGQYITGGGTACLPLSGGAMTGSITLQNEKGIYAYVANGSAAYQIINMSPSNNLAIGSGVTGVGNTYIYGNEVALRAGTAKEKGLILNPNGNVLIGTTTDIGAKLYVNGNFVATGSLTFNMASDRRLKDNIKPLTVKDTIRVLYRLRPVSFEWNEIALSLDNTKEGLCDGFLADEYEKLIPNSGRAIWEKYRAIDYTRAIPYLAKGWQIHESELDKMRKKVKAMERRIEHLENILVEHNIMVA